jgi:hypothetical protein
MNETVNRKDLYIEERRNLRQAPQMQLWAVHLRRMRNGDIDEYIYDRGGFEGYIATIIEESGDPAFAETLFVEAFSGVVQAWIPTALDRPAETTFFVDLIAAYLPPIGYVRLFSKLNDRDQGGSLVASEDPLDLSFRRDLRRKILNTLDSYFPTAIPKSEQAYKDYIKVLEAHLLIESHSAHAAQLLFRRGRLSLNTQRIRRIFQKDCMAVATVFSEILRASSKRKIVNDIRLLYQDTVRSGDAPFAILREEIEKEGGHLDLSGSSRPLVRLPKFGTIILDEVKDRASEGRVLRERWAPGDRNWSDNVIKIERQSTDEQRISMKQGRRVKSEAMRAR